MRTTVDLPASVHRRASQIAAEQHRSLSAVVAELVARGLISIGDSATVTIDELSGFPVIRIGSPVTSADVADALDDE